MNITHAEHEEVTGDKLVAIFNRQKELMEKYHDIEARSGLMQTEDCPVNLDDKRGQARIKDFSWRVMEEVGEALDAFEQEDDAHFCEELVDGLHFLTELTILAGAEPKDLINLDYGGEADYLDAIYSFGRNCKELPTLQELIYSLVLDLGMMCNCLKNKAWKQTNMLTDRTAFYNKLRAVWSDYVGLLGFMMKPDEIADVYLRKSQVNKFRQRSGY